MRKEGREGGASDSSGRPVGQLKSVGGRPRMAPSKWSTAVGRPPVLEMVALDLPNVW